MRGESAGRAVTRGADLLTGRDRVNGDRYQVDTVGGRGGFAERGERGGVFGRKWWQVWPLQVSLAAIGCCRAVWRQVLAAAGLSGGNWLLQGRCEAVTLAPLLMVLLLWNILSAIFKLCCLSSDSLQVAVSFCVVSNQNRNGTELQFSICVLTRWCC